VLTAQRWNLVTGFISLHVKQIFDRVTTSHLCPIGADKDPQ
jgi:hypothetical protein